MYMNVIDLSKSVSFVLEDIDIGGQIQYLTCTGFLKIKEISGGDSLVIFNNGWGWERW